LLYFIIMSTKSIPLRKDVKQEDKWDLTSLYNSLEEWETDLKTVPEMTKTLASFKGRLAENEENLLEALKAFSKLEEAIEKLASYAFLLTTTDASDSSYQDIYGRIMIAASKSEEELSFFVPEIQSIPEEKLTKWIETDNFADFKVAIEKLLWLKPYILSEKEERLFALQMEANGTAQKAFSMLTNVDLDFGTIKTDAGEEALSQSTYSIFLESANRDIREAAYKKFYGTFDKHKNTLASLYAGSVHLDIYNARARGYTSSIEAALYRDKVPLSVYENLIATIHEHKAVFHKYYSLRKKILKLDTLRHWDVYVPLVPEVSRITPYAEAVDILREALRPLGNEYTDILCSGLLNGWVDKYENKGKRSGAFSAGGYTGYPYILMNYKENVLRDVFTLAHEGGHSMHSYYSARNNPFLSYNYTIFEAEVASTFNEDLLFHYLLKHSADNTMKAYLLCNRASDILATLYRQTMFAEFEKITHEKQESGQPLTLDLLRSEYRNLLVSYFGPEMQFESESDLESLRIPHFYSAFYVYKYATGVSASLALAKKVREGTEQERQDYFKFLSSGGSAYPIQALKKAGVNMEEKGPIRAAIQEFENLVTEMEKLLLVQ